MLVSSVVMVFMYGVIFMREYRKQRWILDVSFLYSLCLHSFIFNYTGSHV
jgi:hypothetical protein